MVSASIRQRAEILEGSPVSEAGIALELTTKTLALLLLQLGWQQSFPLPFRGWQ